MIDFDEPLYSHDKLVSDAKALAEQYRSIIQYVTIGRTHDNRDIVLLKLGTGRKHMLFCSGVHGRETINPIVLMRITQYYAEVYNNYLSRKEAFIRRTLDPEILQQKQYEEMIFDKCVYELLQTYTILIIPLLNPDGYMISLTGYHSIRDNKLKESAIKKRIPYAEWKYNARGIDINRNFPSLSWKPKAPGDYAASENETKALIHVFHSYRIRCFIDFHSRGRSIYYYRNIMPEDYNERQLRISKRLAAVTKYELMPPEEEIDYGDTGGNTVHYFSEHFNRVALTIETVPEEAGFPLDNRYRHDTFHELKLVFFELGGLIL